MKSVTILSLLFSFLLIITQSGCEPPLTVPETAQNAIFTPTKIYILPLTDFVQVDDDENQTELKLFVSLLDSFGSQIKAPCVFRFELYEYVKRSSEPMGKRVAIWPDVDLTNAAINNDYWQDYLRAYEFNLPSDPAGDKNHILQITCLCPKGKRLIAEFNFKNTK